MMRRTLDMPSFDDLKYTWNCVYEGPTLTRHLSHINTHETNGNFLNEIICVGVGQ